MNTEIKKVAIIHDWFTILGGAENVTFDIVEMCLNNGYDVEIFCLLNTLSKEKQHKYFKYIKVHTSFLHRLPFIKKWYRYALPLYKYAIESFDLQGFDLVISSSHAVAKNVLVPPNVKHICYCHTPMRYAWDMFFDYFIYKKSFFLLKWYQAYVLHKIRIWDVIASHRVDIFVANSHYIKQRIWRTYRREAQVIYPPVNTHLFQLNDNKRQKYYVMLNRLVAYKKTHIAVQAFQQKKDLKLIVLGTGPELHNLKKMAQGFDNIEIKGFVSNEALHHILQNASAAIMLADEDFGISCIEAQACGTPILALNKGAYKETVIENKTGYFFNQQNTQSLLQAIDHFEKNPLTNHKEIYLHAQQFSKKHFLHQLTQALHNI